MKGFVFGLCVAAIAAVIAVLAPGDLFAQTTAATPTISELVKFDGTDGVITKLAGAIGPLLAAAIGLGLSIWVAKFLFRMVKSMGRG